MGITPFYDKKIICINCTNTFTTSKIRSRSVRVVKHETDFKPVYAESGVNPLFYNVSVCPHCGFSFTEDFTSYFAPGTKNEITTKISALWNRRSFGGIRTIDEAIESYKLALLCATIKREKSLTKAGLALRIAWLYRDKDLKVEEDRFTANARSLYTEAYLEGDHVGTQMSETRVLYLLAELSWRLDDPESAIRNFSKVIENQRTSTEPQLVNMAKERWQEIREFKEKRI